ncbi:hypothetical protein [Streptomyces sp. NPDC098781]|uniref:hypothetical protein n=1 Tax=Streptomyces sp. NPDC098781 TaxID=3366097 RepID=UPI0037FB15A3
MGRRDDVRRRTLDARAEDPGGSGAATNDRDRARELWSAVRCAGLLLVALLLVDWGAGRITPWRAALWFALAGLLLVVLCPARVCAGGNWLTSRRLVREHRVRTDLLVSIRCLDGVSRRLVLRDSLGGRVEIDPDVLVRNPQLWGHLAPGARKAAADGSLRCGRAVLRRLDGEIARAVFRASGMQ